MTDIGAKIGIDGEKQFRKELQEITQTGKTLSAQMDTLTSAFDKNEASEEDLAKVSKKLSEQIENQKKLVDKLKEAVQKSTEKTGENSVVTQKWKEKLAKAEKGLNDLEKESKEAAGGVKELSGAESDASDKTGIFGDVLKGNLASEAIQKGISLTVELIKDAAKFLVDAVKGVAEYADEVNTLSKTTGMSTDAIQEYKYAAELLDVEFSTIEGSLTKLTKKMSDARDGSATASEAFEKLGIRVTNADGSLRNANDVFNDAIDALGKIPNETERDAAAMDLFGKSAKDLNPLIEAGAEGLEAFRQEANNVGAVMDKETLSAMNDANDAFSRLSGTWDALKRTLGTKIGIKILPELEKLVSAFQRLAETGDLSGFVEDVTKQIGGLVKKIPTLVRKIAKELPKALKKLADSNIWSDLAEAIGDSLAAIFQKTPELLKAGLELAGSIIQGALMVLPNMIKRLVTGFDDELEELDEVTNEHVEAVRKKIAELPNVLEDVQRDLDSINGKQREAEYWIDIFDELSKKTDPTAEDTERLQTAVSRLNDLYPDLGLLIDEETGKWTLNTEEIRKNIAAMSDRARAEAYIKAAGKRYEEIVELERDRDALQNELDDVEGRLTEATAHAGVLKEQIAAVEELNKKFRDGEITVEEYKEAWRDLGIEMEPQFGKMKGAYGESIDLLDSNLVRLKTDLYGTENAIKGIEREKKPLNDGIKETQDAIDGLNNEVEWFYQQADSFANAIVDPIAGAADGVYKEGKKIGKRLDDGLKAGIDSGSGIVATAAGRLIQTAINKMKNTAQIKSPSKLTKNLIGKNLALGVIEGWKSVMSGREFKNTFSLSDVMRSMQSDIRPITNNETTNVGGITVNVAKAQNINENRLAEIIMLKMQAQVNRRRNVFSNVLHVQ